MDGRILRLIILTSRVWAATSMNVTTGLHNDTATISVNMCDDTLNMSRLNLDCIFHSNTDKVLLSFLNGREMMDYDARFTGRVRHNISECKINITLSRFKPDDEGNYTCKLLAVTGRTIASATFVLDSSRTSDGKKSDVPPTSPTPEDTKQPPAGPHQDWIGVTAVAVAALVAALAVAAAFAVAAVVTVVVAAVAGVAALVQMVCRRAGLSYCWTTRQARDAPQHQNGDAIELQPFNPDAVSPSPTENGICRRDDLSNLAAQDLV